MHGIVAPQADELQRPRNPLRSIYAWAYRFRWFSLFVLLPTLLTAAYYYIICSDQYVSTADFVVRKSDQISGPPTGIGQLLGFTMGVSQSQSEAYVIQDFLLSHDAVERLERNDSLVQRFTRPGIDLLSRLWSANPRPETLLKYYRDHVDIEQDPESGISHLAVRAFTPEDAYQIDRALLRMGEERINLLNARSFEDQVRHARDDLAEAENALTRTQAKLTDLRLAQGDIDPQGSGKAQISLVSNLTASLVEARSRLEAMGRLISTSSPQYRALASRVATLEAGIAAQQGRLAGTGQGSTASNLRSYEEEVVRREFASQRYTAAAAAFEAARNEARKKQLYLVRVVDANRPVKSLYPERGRRVITVFLSLFMAYAIGRLVLAGLREHAL